MTSDGSPKAKAVYKQSSKIFKLIKIFAISNKGKKNNICLFIKQKLFRYSPSSFQFNSTDDGENSKSFWLINKHRLFCFYLSKILFEQKWVIPQVYNFSPFEFLAGSNLPPLESAKYCQLKVKIFQKTTSSGISTNTIPGPRICHCSLS